MNYSPLERYRQDLLHPDFIPDEAQKSVVNKLQVLYELLKVSQLKKQSPFARWKRRFSSRSVQPVRGLYLWGGVGRGKTYLMDNFYESLPFEKKMRFHFHRFMKMVHEELSGLQNKKDPLEVVADRIAKDADVVCFDEFFVSDIADAMILAGLLEGLFHRGVTLVATSNIVPDGLYKDGLQRARFLPAIALLNKHVEVVNVDGGTDYRLRSLEQAELYHFPLDNNADESLYKSFFSLVSDKEEISEKVGLTIEGRIITARYHAEDVVWFDFMVLCGGPRSQNDYIELAKEYHAVLISGLPELTERREGEARRFINLVDEFYDRGVKLIISAEKPFHDIYHGQRLAFEFDRTVSRLLEMQSHEYLARPHRP